MPEDQKDAAGQAAPGPRDESTRTEQASAAMHEKAQKARQEMGEAVDQVGRALGQAGQKLLDGISRQPTATAALAGAAAFAIACAVGAEELAVAAGGAYVAYQKLSRWREQRGMRARQPRPSGAGAAPA